LLAPPQYTPPYPTHNVHRRRSTKGRRDGAVGWVRPGWKEGDGC
jgi:hypothetical protein